MSRRKLISVAVAALIILGLLAPTSRVDALSGSQIPVIRIGEWKSRSYGVLTPWGGLAFDPAGNLWVADSENNRVLGFTAPFSNNMSASFVIGQPDFLSTAAGIGADRLKFPKNVAFDRAGNLWVVDSDNNRVLEFEVPLYRGMNASVVIGQSNFSTAFFNTTRNGLSGPEQVAFDSSGNVWVADAGNSRVLEFQPPFSSGMNASVVVGEYDFTHNNCNPMLLGYKSYCGNKNILNIPVQIAFDPLADLWVTEAIDTGRILEFKPPFRSGMAASLVLSPVFASALAFDTAGNLWLGCMWCGSTGGGRVLEYRPPLSENSIVWENGVAVNSTISLGGYPPSGNYSFYDVNTIQNVIEPVGLTFDSAGNLWVVDSRSSWLMNLIGRVVGYDAHVHPLDTHEGRVYFENQGGLLAPLSAIPLTQMNSITFPEGLFNFTIQGLPAGGSVTVNITFPQALPSGVKWLTREGGEWAQLPANQTSVSGTNMTLTLTNASQDGVISEFGGPALVPANTTTSTEPTITTGSQPQNHSPLAVLGAATVVVVAAAAMALYRKHSRKPK